MSEAASGTISTGAAGTSVHADLTSTQGPSGIQNGNSTTTVAPAPVVVPDNAPADWTTGLNESSKLYVSQKGFKDPASVLDSYQNLEKLMGAPKERLLRLPDKADAPEWGEVYDKLGRPKEAKDYTFTAPEGMENNKEFTDWAQKQFHELGLTKAQGEALAKRWNDYAVGEQKNTQESYASNLKTEDGALRREWGAAYDKQLHTAQKAASTFGLGKDEVSKLEAALGYSATLKFLSNVGSKLGEDSFEVGGPGAFKGALTPERAQAELVEIRKDREFVQRYLNGGSEEKARMERLQMFANPERYQD